MYTAVCLKKFSWFWCPAGTLDFLGRMDQQAWTALAGESTWKHIRVSEDYLQTQTGTVFLDFLKQVFSVVVVVVVASSCFQSGRTWNVHS